MASSMQEYLKRYASDADKSMKTKKKKKKKRKSEALTEKRYGTGLTVVDADPVWQKEVKEESSESEEEQEDAPLIIKDVEFKRLQRLEALRSRPYLATADDGSGWVQVKENQEEEYTRSQDELPSIEESGNLSPPRKKVMADGTASGLKSGRQMAEEIDKKKVDESRRYKELDASITGRHANTVYRDKHESGNLSPPRKKVMADGTAAGLKSGRQLAEEIDKKKLDDSRRYKGLDASITGRHASTVYRDKHGKKLESFEEMLKLQQGREPVKEEKPLEWGRGLVQKREAEARLVELEAEKSKPFARTRDDPELDKLLREQVRWGDPMAHLVKNKVSELVLEDLGASEQMQESGFVVPQTVPKHSWLKRGITPPPNRYGIKPGRHWDGVDRSTGFEREMFKKQNEKAAERLEAYLWSVADM